MSDVDEEREELWQSVAAIQHIMSLLHDFRSAQDLAATRVALLRRYVDAGGSPILDDLEEDLARVQRFVGAIRSAVLPASDRREALDVRRVCMEAVQLLSPRMRQRGIAIRWTGDKHTRLVASRSAIERSVLNILANSLDACPSKGQTSAEIVFDVTRAADTLALTVRDNGIGCANLPTIGGPGRFQPAGDVLLERGVSTKADRLGLGLFIARRLLEREGGSCHVVEWTRGFAVELRFPMTAEIGS